jgi:hypothetical protein
LIIVRVPQLGDGALAGLIRHRRRERTIAFARDPGVDVAESEAVATACSTAEMPKYARLRSSSREGN